MGGGRKRVWRVRDFARHAFGDDSAPACIRARRLLLRLDAKHGGKLLAGASSRGYTFRPALLAKLEPELFEPIDSVEARLDELEDLVDERVERLSADQRIIASTVAMHSRDLARMRARR
jgi:hypothetical protein